MRQPRGEEPSSAAHLAALAPTRPGEGLNPSDKANPWAGFDAYVRDQCYAMEQSLRIE